MSSLTLRINPIEIPEVLLIVGCHLSTLELKHCMLVSKTWLHLFRTYFWHHHNYTRNVAPAFKTYGHLVRRLSTFNLYDGDLRQIAGACQQVLRLELELSNFPINEGLDILFKSLSHIQELQFRTFNHYFDPHVGCDFQALFNMLDNCRALRSLKLDGIIEMKEAKQYEHPSRAGAYTNVLLERGFLNNARRRPSFWSQLVQKFKGDGPEGSESWRKFSVAEIIPPPPPVRVFEYAVDLFQKPDPTVYLERLTKLSIRNISIGSYGDEDAPLWYIFKKSPYLQELHVDFGGYHHQLVQQCLEAIGETCRVLVTLTLERLYSTEDTRTHIQEFLHRPRKDLVNLKLMECRDVGPVLEHIPRDVAAQFKNLSLERTFIEHQHVHRLLMRCLSLEFFAWTAPKDSVYAQPRLDVLVEPWACMETLRHLEHVHVCTDQDSLNALSNRMEQMPRLVSVGACIEQARISFAKAQKDECKQHSKERPLQECSCRRDAGDDASKLVKEEDEIEIKVSSVSVQELTLDAVPIPPSIFFPVALLKPAEIESILKSYPNLRKIRYRGRTFPLFENGYKWLQAERPDISVIHVSQLPRLSVFEV
ncbi:hypothetical protein CPC16_005599 [Podila verticillata]|nr:hypothetical protein CPC16_005599 [Podila verticillata]